MAYVRSLPCVLSGMNGVDVHHIIGHGQSGMGTKASDLFTFPLTRQNHTDLHSHGVNTWEGKHGLQWYFVLDTALRAINEGVLDVEDFIAEVESLVSEHYQALILEGL